MINIKLNINANGHVMNILHVHDKESYKTLWWNIIVCAPCNQLNDIAVENIWNDQQVIH